MVIREFGDASADIVLIQMTGDHELSMLQNEVEYIQQHSGKAFRLVAIEVEDWNQELSPWKAPPVFGQEGFGDGAKATLEEVLKVCEDKSKKYYLGGYSLAGLFALWAVVETDTFAGCVGASPSIWFPKFLDYMKKHGVKTNAVYLSLGDKEEKTRNQVMATVGSKIREAAAWLAEQKIPSTLEWNQGNHFKEADIRTAKGFVWVMDQ